jgi:hypothetical protein
MNTSHNTHNTEGNEREYAPLEAQLSSYFGAQPDEPLPVDAFWHRLAPHLEMRVGAEHTSATVTDTVQTDRAVATRHIADDIAGAIPIAHPIPAPRPRRFAHVITNIAAIGTVAAICLAAFAIFHVVGLGVPGQRVMTQSAKLSWQKVRLPAGVVLIGNHSITVTENGTPIANGSPTSFPTANAAYYVAPSNGNIAYICQYIGSHAPRIWRTANAGQDWTPLAVMPVSGSFTECGMRADANNANSIFVYLKRTSSSTPGGFTAYAFLDGAAHWLTIAEDMVPLASWGDAYYAVNIPNTQVIPDGAPAGQPQSHLYISTDQLRTWRSLDDTAIIAEGIATQEQTKQASPTGVMLAWVQPTTGELLAQSFDGALWRSTDHGQNWTQLQLPPLPPASQLTPLPGETVMNGGATDAIALVQQPLGNRPFTLCALVFHQQAIAYNVAPLYCSTDSGQTWTRRPRTAVNRGNGNPAAFELPQTMLLDGSLLAWDVRTLSVYPGNDTAAPAAHVIGTIPTPADLNDIPGGQVGVLAGGGAVLWQPHDPLTLYVATYSATTP